MDRKTVTMDFESLRVDRDDDDSFFDSCERLSSAIALDLTSRSDDDDDEFFEASRMSFVSTSIKRVYSIAPIANPSSSSIILPSYDMWIAEPGDVKERRKRLLQGMGLASNRDLLRLATSKAVRAISIKLEPDTVQVPTPPPESNDSVTTEESNTDEPQPQPPPPPPPLRAIVLVRSRSDGDIELFSTKTKERKEEIIGPLSKNKLTRTLSGQLAPSTGACQYSCTVRVFQEGEKNAPSIPETSVSQCVITDDAFGSFFLIKNLDTGKDFIVQEFNEQGMWNKLNDVQTGKQLTMEEFEKSVGYSPVVKELMRRVSRNIRKDGSKSQFTKSFRNGTRRGTALLKNIKGVATSVSGRLVEKEEENDSSQVEQKVDKKAAKRSSQWIDAHQHGKSFKEITALHLSQEIRAHEGSIWTMRFSSDARFLASAGEDTNIHVWEVQECEVMPPKPADDQSPADGTPDPPTDANSSNRLEIASMPSEMRKKYRKSGKGNSLPEHVKVPETVLTLSEKPICTFKGHKDEVLDLSWSRSQLLLSSSMDKSVRMWDMETQSCLKTFEHKDYVTCIQFNPVADDYFISGSLDGKLRIWSVPGHRVADWTDVHEMVTAASYTPDGQGAIVGSQQGSCRIYSIDDSRLEHRQDIQKKKSQAKKFPAFQSQAKKIPGFQSPAPPGKITGFQFAPWNQSEVLVTSANSRIGIYNGSNLVQKFKGFKNTSSQISASFSPNGKYIISASEDSQVYLWKVEESKNAGSGKKKTTVTVHAHEHFQCKDVSVAIAWPGSERIESPVVDLHPKKNAKRPSSALNPAAAAPMTPQEEDDNSAAANSTSSGGLPPLPKKKSEPMKENTSCADEESAQSSAPVDPDTNESCSASASVSDGESASSPASASASATANPSQAQSTSPDTVSSNSNSGGHTMQATAWGMVIVTASLEGEIRVYQNFGLPLKVARQAYLF